nr:MFS transporter [Nocardiopsis flavescens]
MAMAPLALVYLGYAVTGSFLVGGLLVSAHALAEAAAAGWMGRRFDRRPARRETALVLGAEGVFFLLLFAFAHHLSLPLMILLAVLGGAVSAGTYGGLRSLLQHMVPGHSRPAALGLEETASATVWAASPALAGVLIAVGSGTWPVGAMALASFLGGLTALALPHRSPLPAPDRAGAGRRRRSGGLLRLFWPSLAQDGAAVFTLGAAAVCLPALLMDTGTGAALPGLILGAASAAGVVGGLAYGSRRWPRQRAHATGLLLLYCTLVGGVGGVGLLNEAYLAGALFIAAGVVQVPALMSRALVVQGQVPRRDWGFAFSALYAAKGIGHGAAGLTAGAAIAAVGPAWAVIACAAVALAVALSAGISDLLRNRRTAGSDTPPGPGGSRDL